MFYVMLNFLGKFMIVIDDVDKNFEIGGIIKSEEITHMSTLSSSLIRKKSVFGFPFSRERKLFLRGIFLLHVCYVVIEPGFLL